MSSGVQGKMVGSCKGLGANLAEERTCSGVFSRVSRQLVRSREGVAAVRPRTGVGPFSGVNPHVALQLGLGGE